ncbi:MAG: DUF6268 family outer membrane beta-barrel protein [Bacteroidia bacterium]
MRKLVFLLLVFSQTSWANKDSLTSKKLVKAKEYCKARIEGMSPNKVISVGYDYEFGQTLKSSSIASFDSDEKVDFVENTKFKNARGLRFNTRLPIINKTKLVWLLGLNYWKANYLKESHSSPIFSHKFGGELTELTTSGISTSIFKPFNAKSFMIFAGSVDLNGDYSLNKMQPIKYLKYSIAAMYGQKVHDRKNWALGVSRSYGGGMATILPVILFNYTAPSKKWGTEILLPSRAWYRYSFNQNSLCRLGFELEGASYRLLNINTDVKNMELRRGQLRTKAEYQHKLYKSLWIAVQTGYSVVLNYNLDYLGPNKNDFHRGVIGNDKYAMINDLSNFMFLNVSINLVSL